MTTGARSPRRTPTSSASRTRWAASRARCDTAKAMGMHFDDPVNQHSGRLLDIDRPDSARSPSARTRPARWTSPAPTRPRRQRHPVRPHAGDRDPRPDRPAAQGRRRQADRHRRPLQARGHPARRREHAGQHDGRRRRPAAPAAGRPSRATTIAGKTGTTQDNKTAAFVGITPDYAVSVMYFDPLGKIKRRRRRRRRPGARSSTTRWRRSWPASRTRPSRRPTRRSRPAPRAAATVPAAAAGPTPARPTPTPPTAPAPTDRAPGRRRPHPPATADAGDAGTGGGPGGGGRRRHRGGGR